MSECMDCACKSVVAIDRITDVARYIGYFTEELPETLSKVDKELMDDKTRSALHTLKEVEQVCHVKMEDVKAHVNFANLTFKEQKFFPAYDHILDAKAKFKTKICKTGI